VNPILEAAIYAGLPLVVVSFLMVSWAIKKQYMTADDEIKILKEKAKLKDEQEPRYNPVHKKWLYFGGGYFGLMAMVTYLYLEVKEVIDFIGNYESFSHLMDQVTIGAFIKLVIDSFLNLIPAFTWFIYWPKEVEIVNGWYWLVASYIGYHVGNSLAKQFAIRTHK
jgi:hypothetical protein